MIMMLMMLRLVIMIYISCVAHDVDNDNDVENVLDADDDNAMKAPDNVDVDGDYLWTCRGDVWQ